ncbi:ABC transporter ATP-binding protein, partial [Streptomyces sp. NPDC049577]
AVALAATGVGLGAPPALADTVSVSYACTGPGVDPVSGTPLIVPVGRHHRGTRAGAGRAGTAGTAGTPVSRR